MNTRMGIICISLVAAVSLARTAYAATCNSVEGCLEWDNDGAGPGLVGDSAGYGVDGITGSGVGVRGDATSGVGVQGESNYIGGNFIGYGARGTGIQSTGVTAAWLDGNVYSTATYYSTGSQTTLAHYSDLRLKKNVKSLEGSLDQLLRLRGVTYEWKAPEEHGNEQGPQRGFIAQEVETVFPDWVGTDAKGMKTLNTRGLEPMLVESLRTLKIQNDALRAQSSKLEERVRALEAGRSVSSSGLGRQVGFAGLALMVGLLALSRGRRPMA
jgi:hypothetical protein